MTPSQRVRKCTPPIHAAAEAARRHATMLSKDLRDDNRIVLEHLVALSARVDALARR